MHIALYSSRRTSTTSSMRVHIVLYNNCHTPLYAYRIVAYKPPYQIHVSYLDNNSGRVHIALHMRWQRKGPCVGGQLPVIQVLPVHNEHLDLQYVRLKNERILSGNGPCHGYLPDLSKDVLEAGTHRLGLDTWE